MQDLVVITGSSGRLGSRLLQRLKGSYTLVGMDMQAPKFKDDSFSFIYADFSSEESMKKAFEQLKKEKGSKIASVIHLAAYYSFEGGAWEKYEQITVEGTRRLLQNLSSFEVEQFIFSSTLLVYKPTEPGVKINESSELDPSWAYPKSKVLTEKVIQENKGNISSVILRIAGCYDEGCHSIPLSQMMQRIYEKDLTSHVFPGNLNHGASFLHFADFVEGLVKVLDKRKDLGKEELFLMGEPETYSYKELQDKLGELIHNKKWITIRIPKWIAKIGAWLQLVFPSKNKPFIRPWMIDLADDHFELDLAHSEKVLGWKPQKNLLQTLPEMVKILKDSPILWYRENGIPYTKKP